MNLRAKRTVAAMALMVIAAVIVVVVITRANNRPNESPTGGGEKLAAKKQRLRKSRKLETQAYELKKEAEERKASEAKRRARELKTSKEMAPASEGVNGSLAGTKSGSPSSKGAANESVSFRKLQAEIPGEVGVAFAALGSNSIQAYGGTAVDHAWSSFKVPIIVTLMEAQEGTLTPDQESLAASAITASDNAAAASLFSDLEEATGNAAGAVEAAVSQIPNGATAVATAPPPPGAYSSWGQTEWTLKAATAFYGALACGSFGDVTQVLADMESIIPEQEWGLGQARFPGARVAYKAGWGPDGSASGPYLVRQSGIIRLPSGEGTAVTIAAQDESGSFEGGVADLDRVADWVAENVPLDGSCP
jgi:hypothetical protein